MTPSKVLFHDDGCGTDLESDGMCPRCGFHPDMQSLGLRELDELRTIVKPLHVRVAEKLGVVECGRWQLWGTGLAGPEYTLSGVCPEHSNLCIPIGGLPRYDTSWAALGPIIERLGIELHYTPAALFPARYSESTGELTSKEQVLPASWEARKRLGRDEYVKRGQFFTSGLTEQTEYGPTPLLAVCALLLALPDEVVRESGPAGA